MPGPEVPIYESTMRVPEGPRPGLQVQNPPVPDMSGIGKAVTELADAGNEFAVKLAKGKNETQDASLKTDYLTKIAGLRDTYANSEDFQNAPAQFTAERTKLEDNLSGQVLDDKRRAELKLYFAVHGLEAQKQVNQKALANEGDFNLAGLNQRSAEYVRKAASAGSLPERQGIFETWNADIDKQVAAGWISRVDGASRKITGKQNVDDADAIAMIRINPRQAMEELQNPERFPDLGPIQRENLINQAKAQLDTVKVLELQNMAKRDATRAAGMVGRVGAVTEADGVFSRGIIPIESGGKHDLVSPAGALGLTQLMPATARAQAKAMGMADVAALSDEALQARLLDEKDPLNHTLGLNHWRSLVGRYDGNIYAAAAAYNAGSGSADKPRADAWVAEATRRYGPNFSPAELAEVIPIKETKDYVLKLADRLGAPRGGLGLSAAGAYHASAAVSSAIAGQDSEQRNAIKAIAQVGRETDDPATVFKAGYDVDPAKYAAWKQTQTAAALAGSVEAAKAVREAELQRELLPFRQQALRTPPAQLEALVQAETARLASSPNVSIDEKNRLDVARETLKSVVQNRKDNIVGLAEQGGLVPADQRVAVDPKADVGSQDFGRALALRGAQANGAAKFYDGAAIALKPQELAAMKQRWADAQPGEQFRMLQAFGRHLDGQAYVDTLNAVIGETRNGDMIGRLARDRPELAREILEGSKLLDEKSVQERTKDALPNLKAALGSQIYPNADMQQAVVSAALALDVARKSRNAGLYDPQDTSGLQQAIEDITGPIVKHNGRRTPIAPSIAPRDFRDTLDRLSDDQVRTMGGAYGRDARPFSAREISDRGQLVPLMPGSTRYVVQMPTSDGKGAPVLTYSGTPLVLDMRTLAASRAPIQPTPYEKGVAITRGAAARRLQADKAASEQ